MRHVLLTLTFASLLCAGALAALGRNVPDFSGTWVSDGRAFTLVDRVDTHPRGWANHLDNLARSREYIVVVAQTDAEVGLTFPSGTNNLLTMHPYDLSGEVKTIVDSQGDWWKKQILRAYQDGATLRLAATHQSGWWRKASPESVTHQPTQLDLTHVLSLSTDTSTLTIETMVADDKGRATYRQVFRRAS